MPMECARKSFQGPRVNDRPWDVFHQHWPALKPPLAVAPEVASAIAAAIAGHERHGLLLGVTPQLADLAEDTVALDWSEAMVARVWPGDTPRRRAVQADWRTMPIVEPQFTAIIGDGSFNCLEYPSGYRAVFAELERVLKPGGRFAVRFFVTPSPCETFQEIRDGALGGRILAMDALKWRLAMAVAARSGPNVARGTILDAFESAFPDRAALLAASGWSKGDFATVDWYKNMPDIISFPTAREILKSVPASFGNARFVSSGSYELAERCPLLVMDFHR